MSLPLLAVVVLIYMYTGIEQMWKGNVSGGIMWLSYACGTTALMWHTR